MQNQPYDPNAYGQPSQPVTPSAYDPNIYLPGQVSAGHDPIIRPSDDQSAAAVGYKSDVYAQAGYDPNAYVQAGYDPNAYVQPGQSGVPVAGYDPNAYTQANYDPNAYGQPEQSGTAVAYDPNAYVQAGYDPNAYVQPGQSGVPVAGYDPNAYGQPAASYLFTVTDLTGQTLYLNDVLVIGRRPDPAISGYPQAQIMTVPSPAKQISRTHCLLLVSGGIAYISDLNSVNGTKILRGQQSWPVEPGTSVPLENGDIIDLGEGQYLTIGMAQASSW